MNKIRLDFAAEIKYYSTPHYNLNTSKSKKLSDKRELDKKIHEARGPLLQILKLTKDDLHHLDQMSILEKVSLGDKTKKITLDRKAQLAEAKKRILFAYRQNPSIDIKKYAKETQVLS
jgi:hypothetical protein